MRVHLKGLHSATKRLASGERRVYWYAWRGGPRIEGKPGTPAFNAAYYAALAARKRPKAGTLHAVIAGYKDSQEFLGLRDRTRADYLGKIKLIEAEFGDTPLAAMTDKRTRGEFKDWRDKLAKASVRQADYAWTVLARILSWGLDRGKVDANPCERGGRLYKADRNDHVWTDEMEAAFLAKAPKRLHLALLLALWTGQRQGDLIALPWSAYDGQRIRLRQSKTGKRLSIKVGAPLKAALDAAPRLSPIILVNADKRPWTPDGFRVSWRKGCARAGVEGVTFHDLRGSAVTRLALAGSTEAEIVTFTGLSHRDVHEILDSHYLSRDDALGDSAVEKLEARTGITNCASNRSTGSADRSGIVQGGGEQKREENQ